MTQPEGLEGDCAVGAGISNYAKSAMSPEP
jgi:hypothetical protein